MKKSIKSGIAVALALAVVVSAGIYSNDAKLKASDENVYEEQPAEVTPATEVHEIIIDIPAAPAEPEPVAEPEAPAEDPAPAAAEESAAPAEENNGAAEETEVPAEAETEETAAPAEEIEEAEEPEAAEAPAEEAEESEESEDAEEPEESEEDEEPAEEDEEEPELRVWITTSLDGVESVESGTVITLTAHLEGFEDIEYTVQWQKSLNGIDWEDEIGATELVYRFALTEANDDYIWRIMIYTED